MKKLYNFVGGRAITFAWFCILSATALAACNRLPAAYAACISSLCGFVVYRSVKDVPPVPPGDSNG
jgi:hypothetical protein